MQNTLSPIHPMTPEKPAAGEAGLQDPDIDAVLEGDDERHARSGANDALFAYLKAHGAVLFKQDNVFRVRISGMARLDAERVPFCLVPPDGALMKAGKWKKTSPEQRLALIQERVNASSVLAMTARVTSFVSRAQALAHDLDLDADQFWPGLVTDGLDEDARCATILERMRAAHARLQESRNAEKARAAISLKQYPESFPAAGMPRRLSLCWARPTRARRIARWRR
jgi:ATP-dependent RNA helicase SUPV3L1/SUV3